jgi:signal transduction histidine kinase/ligand-binding sensor domain-containing protein
VRVLYSKYNLLSIIIILAVASSLLLPCLSKPVFAQDNPLRFENISTDQGLTQSTVNAILQDRQGFLWFATEGGVNYYDGYQFSYYQHDPDNPNSLSDNLVFTIYEDRNDNLWIGTKLGLDRLDRSTGVIIHTLMNLTNLDDANGLPVTAIDQDLSGMLWFGTDGHGLYALDLTNNHLSKFSFSPDDLRSLSSDTINTLYVSHEGDLWVGTEAGLDRFEQSSGSFIHYSQSSSNLPIQENSPVYSLFEDSEGILWIGTRNGLIQWDQTANRSNIYQHDPNIPQSLSSNVVVSIYGDSQGTLWIGTGGGLEQFDKVQDGFTHYIHDPRNSFSLSSDYVRCIYEDHSGVLWIGTSDGGLNKYARSTQKFIQYDNYPGLTNSLSDNNIWSLYEDNSNNLWIGTFFSGLNKLDLISGEVKIYQHDPSNPSSLSNNEIRAILQDQNGYIWVGTEHGGLNRFDPVTDTFLHYQHDNDDPTSLSSDNVFSLYEDHQGRLWVGTDNGGLNRFDQSSGKFIHYLHDANDPSSLSNDNVRAIYEDNTGIIWLGTFGGIDLLDEQTNQFTVYKYDPGDSAGLSNDFVATIVEDKTGTIWIGTFGGGLDRFDRTTQTFLHFTQTNGLPDDTIYGILVAENGSLWLSTNKGLSNFNPDKQTFRNYDTTDGLLGNQFNPGGYFQSENGEIFFGGVKGITAFYPLQVTDNPIPPPVVVTVFKIYNQTVQTNLAADSTIQLSYRDNFISFEFAALDYNAPQKNHYAYQLVGVDKDWVYAGTRRFASYTNLRWGDYTFMVKASNNDGIWNEQPTIVYIDITPPFWQMWWFIGGTVLLALMGVYGGYRWRVSSIEARNRELERQVEERTRESEQRSKVAQRLYDIVNKINSNASVDEVLNFIVTQADLLSETNFVALWLLKSSQGPFHLHSIRGEFPKAMLNLEMAIDEGMLGLAVKERRNIYFSDMSQVQYAMKVSGIDDKHPVYMSESNQDVLNQVLETFKAIMVVPLVTTNGIYGALEFFYPAQRNFSQEEITLASAFAEQAALAVENAILRTQSTQSAVLSERSRLARELHDSVSQLLYSVTLYAEAAAELLEEGETLTASEHLRELRDTAQEALREMRLLIFELHRPEIRKAGLTGALQARLDAVETRGGMHSELLMEGDKQPPFPIQEELYNIAHEALNNVLKHAHAKNVSIHIWFDTAGTKLKIVDDGVGFDECMKKIGGGFGIPGMYERAQSIGGSLHIESMPGKGTKIMVWVPRTAIEGPDGSTTSIN